VVLWLDNNICLSRHVLVNIHSSIPTFPLLGNPTIVFRVHLFHVTCRSGLTAMHLMDIVLYCIVSLPCDTTVYIFPLPCYSRYASVF